MECPVCGQYKFKSEDDFDVCPICEWENDGLQSKNPDYWGGANELSLNDYRKEWAKRRDKSRQAASR